MKRAMIVDDKDENRYLLHVLLQGHGWEVEEAHHGAEALVKARQHRPHLVVSDLLMPVMDGYSLLRHWRADPALRDIPFIVYTATYTDPQDERLALELGADAFVVKPADPEDFIKQIAAVAHDGVLSKPVRLPDPAHLAELTQEYNAALVRKLEEKTLLLSETNRALAERERQLSSLLRNFPGIAYRCRNDPNYTLEFVSDRASDLLGYSVDALVTGKINVAALIVDEDRERVWNDVQTAVQADRPWEVDYRIRTARGAIRWFWERGYGVRGPSGHVEWLEGFALDITERKHAEEALRASEARLQLSLSAARMGTWDWDLATGHIVWSEGHEELWGMGRGTFQGTYAEFDARLHPDDRPRLERAVRLALETHTEYNCEFRVIWPDGSVHWIAGRGHPIYQDARPVRMIGVVMDIDERKRAEEALRASEARLRDILDSMFAFVGLLSTDGVLLEVNRAPLEAAGVNKADVIGKPMLETPWVRDLPSTQAQLRAALARAVRGETVRQDFELAVQGGAKIIVDGTFAPLFDAYGRVAQVVASGVDITDRKQAEVARQKLEAQLWQAQKMEALGTLAGGVAHDFNNILSAIIGNAELARQDMGPNHPAIRSLNEIRKAAQRAKSVVRQILAFSRKQPLERRVLSLKPVIEECTMMLRATLPSTVELRVHCSDDAPNVLADPTQIHQVLLNLCTNAWQALPDGAGRIEVRLERAEIDTPMAAQSIDNLHEGRYACLTVSDTGSGMDAATLERIFEPFYTTKEAGEGSGLGLAVVDGIMKSHDGAIRVTSAPGVGSTFALYFPAADRPIEPLAPNHAMGATPGGGESILYVDDDEAIVYLVTRILERHGYRVTGLSQPVQALEAVRATPNAFDVVITDFTMPNLSGLQLARQLKTIRPDLPIILTSGYVDEDLQQRARDAGIVQVLFKPDTIEQLCAAIQAAIADAERK